MNLCRPYAGHDIYVPGESRLAVVHGRLRPADHIRNLSFVHRLHNVAQERSLSHPGASAPPPGRRVLRPSPRALPRRRHSPALSPVPSSRGRAAVARTPTSCEGQSPPGGERPRARTGPAQRGSSLQLLPELVQEAPVGALGDDLLGTRLDHPGLVKAEGIETNRVLRVIVAPLRVWQFLHRLERIVVNLGEALV